MSLDVLLFDFGVVVVFIYVVVIVVFIDVIIVNVVFVVIVLFMDDVVDEYVFVLLKKKRLRLYYVFRNVKKFCYFIIENFFLYFF